MHVAISYSQQICTSGKAEQNEVECSEAEQNEVEHTVLLCSVIHITKPE